VYIAIFVFKTPREYAFSCISDVRYGLAIFDILRLFWRRLVPRWVSKHMSALGSDRCEND